MAHKLLLADDSLTIQRVIELTFADEDIQVLVAADGRQAIERIQAERPDVVLADVGMPGRDGYEVARFVKSTPELSGIPVILLAGAFEPLDEGRARAVGCDGVLVKPFEPQVVIDRVKNLLAAREGAARPPQGGPPAGRVPIPVSAAPPLDAGAAARIGVLGEPAAEKGAGESLEDYFDRLDAAFANIGAKPHPAAAAADLSAGIKELEHFSMESPQTEPRPPEPEPGRETVTAPAGLADAFSALLAAEEGRPAPDPLEALGVAARPAPALADGAIDEIVERVIARMADDSMRRLVLETAERLVREEIERIKASSRAIEPHSGG